ncbi:hypothetical protein [Flavobacterium sp.]|jgi:hypothetical protein|uniref:hypothetical protein n=1 Tax=Flavobacterium sp. TaxID=239 RepID=UPI0037BFCD10
MKLGKFTFAKWKWYYNGSELNNPIVIIWRALWTIPIYLLGYLLWFALLIGRGSFYAEDFRQTYLF